MTPAKSSKSACLTLCLLLSLFSCKEEIRQLTPPAEPACQAPPIEQNIVGTWHFSANMKKGIITFTNNKMISDPDSLFENWFVVGGQVVTKMYDFKFVNKSQTESKQTVLIRQITKSGEYGTYYNIIANECKKIQLSVTTGGNAGFTLTR